jgi:hypothetical protein
MLDRFSIFVRRNRGVLGGFGAATVSSTVIILSVMLNYDRFVNAFAKDILDIRTRNNISKVDKHNEEYPDDLWEYTDYSFEDVLGEAKFWAAFFLALMIFAVVSISLIVGYGYDIPSRRTALPPSVDAPGEVAAPGEATAERGQTSAQITSEVSSSGEKSRCSAS